MIAGLEQAEFVAGGGFSEVYRARQPQFDRTVAVKLLRTPILDERVQRQFRRECAAAGRLTGHPNLVTVLDSGFTGDGRPYIVMEWMAGGSLEDMLAAAGPLPVQDVLRIGVKICGVLQAAHEAGITHRDVKPANIMISAFGEPALGDFGISSLSSGHGSTTGMGALTPLHSAPEVIEEDRASAVADEYSLASTLYTLLAGAAPFAGPPGEAIMPAIVRILGDPIPPLARADVPAELVAVLERALAKSPQDRYPSVADFAAALQDVQRHLGLDVTELTKLPPGAATQTGTATVAPVVPAGSVTVDRTRPATSAPDAAVLPAAPPLPAATAPPGAAAGPQQTVTRAATDLPVAAAPEESATRSPTLRGIAFGVGAGLVVALAVLVLVVLTRPDATTATDTTTTGASPAGALSAPVITELVDAGESVRVVWRDDTGGSFPHLVAHGDSTGWESNPDPVATGVTEYDVTGLDPDVGYCFRVLVVTEGDVVASDPDCLRGGSPPGPAAPASQPTATASP